MSGIVTKETVKRSIANLEVKQRLSTLTVFVGTWKQKKIYSDGYHVVVNRDQVEECIGNVFEK